MAENKSPVGDTKVEHPDPDQDPPSVKGAKRVGEDKAVKGGRPDGPIITSEGSLPAEADKSSYPGPGDAKSEDPPARTTRPNVPIAVSSAVGAGQHVPPDPDEYTPEGRPKGLPGSGDDEEK